MKYITEITMKQTGDMDMWKVVIYYTTGKSTEIIKPTLPEALLFASHKIQEEIELDSVPF